MEKILNLLSKVDEHDFLNIYFVISSPKMDTIAIESIAFLTYEEAQNQCDYMCKRYNTKKYRVFNTVMHI